MALPLPRRTGHLSDRDAVQLVGRAHAGEDLRRAREPSVIQALHVIAGASSLFDKCPRLLMRPKQSIAHNNYPI